MTRSKPEGLIEGKKVLRKGHRFLGQSHKKIAPVLCQTKLQGGYEEMVVLPESFSKKARCKFSTSKLPYPRHSPGAEG